MTPEQALEFLCQGAVHGYPLARLNDFNAARETLLKHIQPAAIAKAKADEPAPVQA